MNRWLIFIQQRFSPVTYTLTIFLFVAAQVHISKTQDQPYWKFLLLFIATLLFFFLLRLYDELKDYDLDVSIHPDRPLVTGVISLTETKKAMVFCLITSLLLFLTVSSKGSIAFLLVAIYSLFMYKEFFISRYLRKHLLLYAVSHTFISAMLSIALISSLTNTYFWLLPSFFYIFALSTWFTFNIFEFGRKTYAFIEEKAGIDSYSKRYSRYGAVALVLSMLFAIHPTLSIDLRRTHLVVIIIFLAISAIYLFKNDILTAKIYRAFCACYLILIFLLISMG